MCFYAPVFYSCGCPGEDKVWCKSQAKKRMTKLWDNCQQDSTLGFRTGQPMSPIHKRERCVKCHKQWWEDLLDFWEDSWEDIYMESGFSSAALREERSCKKEFYCRSDKLYLSTLDPEGDADIYRDLPQWVKEQLAATKSKHKAVEGLLTLLKRRFRR